MADFSFFVAAESFELVESFGQEGIHPESGPSEEIVGSGSCRVERNASADGLTYIWVDRMFL